MFDNHMKLHYSQTSNVPTQYGLEFDNHMKLHYSQTIICAGNGSITFDNHMKLHYSQTIWIPIISSFRLTTI